MRKATRICLWILFVFLVLVSVPRPQPSQAALTISGTQLDAWAAVAEDDIRIGAVADISDSYSTKLLIDVAITGTDLHEGTRIKVQTCAAADGNDWSDYRVFTCLTDRAATAPDSEAMVGAITDANSVIDVADTDAGKWEQEGVTWFFIEDGTVANSEMLQVKSYTNDASIALVNKPANAHANSTVMWDTAEKFQVNIPMGYSRVQVIYDNTLDGDGTANEIHCHCHIIQTTTIQ
jgi:hypothetical protein